MRRVFSVLSVFMCWPLLCLSLEAEPALTENASLWTLNHVGLSGDGLRPEAGSGWSEAWVHFATPVEVTEGGVVLSFEMRTDRAKGEDFGAVYCKLHFTKDPARREQVSVNACVRPSNRWYMLYLDPGWQLQNLHYTMLRPVGERFVDTQSKESFRLVLRRMEGVLVGSLSCLDAKLGWVVLRSEEKVSEIRPEIARELEGQTSIKSLSFQFPGDVSSISAVRLEPLAH